MDRWKFFAVTRKYHVIDNPTSLEKVDQVVHALRLPPGACVLEIACGKAEMLCRIADTYSAKCTGVEISPQMCEEAARKVIRRGLTGLVDIKNMPGQEYRAPAGGFHASLCVGATWVFGGMRGTLAALAGWTQADGLVVTGEPFWIKPPPQEYLDAEGWRREIFASHVGNFEIGESLGLEPVFSVVSSHDDFDSYEWLAQLAGSDYARDNPADPDAPEILERNRRARWSYLHWGRDYMGWAIYVFRRRK